MVKRNTMVMNIRGDMNDSCALNFFFLMLKSDTIREISNAMIKMESIITARIDMI